MKKIINICIGMLGIFLITSCELAKDLDDFTPPYALEADKAITNENTAELALVGVYSSFRQSDEYGTPYLFCVPEVLSGYGGASPYQTNPEYMGWVTSKPVVDKASTTGGIYAGMYNLINRANWLIEKVSALNDNAFITPGRKQSIIGEAKILRALGNFYLLRLFGQFYDINSEYGNVIRTEPVRDAAARPRNTVAETYTAILGDLDEGIANAPDLRGKFYTNKTFAKGLKARVLLYKGDYSAAATLAKSIIDNVNDNFKLESSYKSIFGDHTSTAIFNSSEVLFGSRGDANEGLGIGNFFSGYYVNISQKYVDEVSDSVVIGTQNIKYDEGRVSSILNVNYSYGGYWLSKYTSYFSSGEYEMIYHMRMAEVYLIFAEASARATSSVTKDALDALNTIRIRGGATTTGANGFETYPASITYNQFLKAVRIEKLIELEAENGETWFDLIRYDYADGFGSGFKVSDIKVTATNPDKFILGIPQESIDVGGKVVKQNPSY